MKRRQLSQREESILLLLKRFDFMTRDQLRRYFRIGTIRHTNRVLEGLSDYLMRIRDGTQTIFYLNKHGRQYVNCDKVRKKGGHVQHTVMRNDLWLHYGCPGEWRSEIKVSDGKATVIVDAMFTQSLRYHFLEVDHTQTMAENRTKIKRYTELYNNGLLAKQLGHYPTVVWLTTTELRRQQLQDACKTLPIAKVFTISDIK